MSVDESPVAVLYVDDEPGMADLVATQLERVDDRLTVTTATSVREALDLFADADIDCIVSAHELPDVDGLAFLQAVRADHPDMPFILFTAYGSEEIASDAISAGVTDYVQKSHVVEQFSLLAQRVENAVERHRALQEAQQAHEQARAILDAAPDGVIVSVDSECVYVNPAAVELFGADSRETLLESPLADTLATVRESDERGDDGTGNTDGERDEEHTAEAGADTIADLLTAVEAEEHVVEQRRERVTGPDGATLVVDLTARPVTWNGDDGAVFVFREASETQQQPKDTVDALGALYRTVSDPDLSFEEKQDQILELGRQHLDVPYAFVSEITPTTQTIVAARSSHDLLQPGESCALEQSYCRKTLETESGLLTVQNATEEGWEDDTAYETFELETYIGARLLVHDELFGTLCFADSEPRDREFTDGERVLVEVMARLLAYERGRKQYETQLEEQNERLEEFASVLSHDLRNPLNVARGRLEMVELECESEHIEHVSKAHDRIETLISDMLTLAREASSVGDIESVDLGETVEECWQTVATGDARLSVETAHTVRADETRLKQLLENLVRNAVEHGSTSPDSQTPQDATEHDGEDNEVTVTIGDLSDGFYVEDDGPGIPPERREKVLDAGYSTAREGTGFGLSIVERIVDAHGWEIAIAESESGGARFDITGVELAEQHQSAD